MITRAGALFVAGAPEDGRSKDAAAVTAVIMVLATLTVIALVAADPGQANADTLGCQLMVKPPSRVMI